MPGSRSKVEPRPFYAARPRVRKRRMRRRRSAALPPRAAGPRSSPRRCGEPVSPPRRGPWRSRIAPQAARLLRRTSDGAAVDRPTSCAPAAPDTPWRAPAFPDRSCCRTQSDSAPAPSRAAAGSYECSRLVPARRAKFMRETPQRKRPAVRAPVSEWPAALGVARSRAGVDPDADEPSPAGHRFADRASGRERGPRRRRAPCRARDRARSRARLH